LRDLRAINNQGVKMIEPKRTTHQAKYFLKWEKGGISNERAYSNYEYVMAFSLELIRDGYEVTLKLGLLNP
jgi:hypothetical protein